MKALTVRQPWASLIIEGHKDVENRSWPTGYRGDLFIHAAGAKVDEATEDIWGLLDSYAPLGVILGVVDLVDCRRDHPSGWATADAWHWVLQNPRPCRPLPAKGNSGLWTPPPAASPSSA